MSKQLFDRVPATTPLKGVSRRESCIADAATPRGRRLDAMRLPRLTHTIVMALRRAFKAVGRSSSAAIGAV